MRRVLRFWLTACTACAAFAVLTSTPAAAASTQTASAINGDSASDAKKSGKKAPDASEPSRPADGQEPAKPNGDEASAAPQAPAAAAAAAAADDIDEDDLSINKSHTDFSTVNLPTTLRLPKHKFAIRVTHRFTRPLGEGDFGDLASDLFGLDSAGVIGLEGRFGVMRGVQYVFQRVRDREIQMSGHVDIMQQHRSKPVSMMAIVDVSGLDNFSEDFGAGVGFTISRAIEDKASFYASPMFVGNTFVERFPGRVPPDDGDNTFLIGLGARVKIRPTVNVVAEVTPRIAGYTPGDPIMAFAIEKRVGGHSFQFNFSNSFFTTWRRLAEGAPNFEDWYIGFNLTRKLF